MFNFNVFLIIKDPVSVFAYSMMVLHHDIMWLIIVVVFIIFYFLTIILKDYRWRIPSIRFISLFYRYLEVFSLFYLFRSRNIYMVTSGYYFWFLDCNVRFITYLFKLDSSWLTRFIVYHYGTKNMVYGFEEDFDISPYPYVKFTENLKLLNNIVLSKHLSLYIDGSLNFAGLLYDSYPEILKVGYFRRNLNLELFFGSVPTGTVGSFISPSMSLLFSADDVSVDTSMSLKITGHQWFWSYEYSGYIETLETVNNLKPTPRSLGDLWLIWKKLSGKLLDGKARDNNKNNKVCPIPLNDDENNKVCPIPLNDDENNKVCPIPLNDDENNKVCPIPLNDDENNKVCPIPLNDDENNKVCPIPLKDSRIAKSGSGEPEKNKECSVDILKRFFSPDSTNFKEDMTKVYFGVIGSFMYSTEKDNPLYQKIFGFFSEIFLYVDSSFEVSKYKLSEELNIPLDELEKKTVFEKADLLKLTFWDVMVYFSLRDRRIYQEHYLIGFFKVLCELINSHPELLKFDDMDFINSHNMLYRMRLFYESRNEAKSSNEKYTYVENGEETSTRNLLIGFVTCLDKNDWVPFKKFLDSIDDNDYDSALKRSNFLKFMHNDGLTEFSISELTARKMIALHKFVNVMTNFAIVIYDEVMSSEGNNCQKEFFKYTFGYDEFVFDRMEALFTTFFYKLLKLKDEAAKNDEFIAVPFLDYDMLPISEFTFKKDSSLFEVIYHNVLLDDKLSNNKVPLFLDILCPNFGNYKDSDSNLELSKIRLYSDLKSKCSLQIPIVCQLPLDNNSLRELETLYNDPNKDHLGVISRRLINNEIKEAIKAHDEFLDGKTIKIHEALKNFNFYSDKRVSGIGPTKFSDVDVDHNDNKNNEESNPETCLAKVKDKNKVALYHVSVLSGSLDEKLIDKKNNICDDPDNLISAVLSPSSFIVQTLRENMLCAKRNTPLGRLKIAIQTFDPEFWEEYVTSQEVRDFFDGYVRQGLSWKHAKLDSDLIIDNLDNTVSHLKYSILKPEDVSNVVIKLYQGFKVESLNYDKYELGFKTFFKLFCEFGSAFEDQRVERDSLDALIAANYPRDEALLSILTPELKKFLSRIRLTGEHFIGCHTDDGGLSPVAVKRIVINDLNNIRYESYLNREPYLIKGSRRLYEVSKIVFLPTNISIRFLITSGDVLHSWSVPELGVKVDAVPGRLNSSLAFVRRPGYFYGQCTELCGVGHAYMPIVIKAVPDESFLEWVNHNVPN